MPRRSALVRPIHRPASTRAGRLRPPAGRSSSACSSPEAEQARNPRRPVLARPPPAARCSSRTARPSAGQGVPARSGQADRPAAADGFRLIVDANRGYVPGLYRTIQRFGPGWLDQAMRPPVRRVWPGGTPAARRRCRQRAGLATQLAGPAWWFFSTLSRPLTHNYSGREKAPGQEPRLCSLCARRELGVASRALFQGQALGSHCERKLRCLPDPS